MLANSVGCPGYRGDARPGPLCSLYASEGWNPSIQQGSKICSAEACKIDCRGERVLLLVLQAPRSPLQDNLRDFLCLRSLRGLSHGENFLSARQVVIWQRLGSPQGQAGQRAQAPPACVFILQGTCPTVSLAVC